MTRTVLAMLVGSVIVLGGSPAGSFDPDGDDPIGTNRYVATDAAPVNTCDTRFRGEGPDVPPEDWRDRLRRVGPLSFDPNVYSDFPADAFEPPATDLGVSFVVDAAASATVSIAPESRDSAAFIDLVAFRPPGGPNANVVELLQSIRLEACPTVETLFAVGMTLARAQCVLVDVAIPGGQSRRIALSFGVGVCPGDPGEAVHVEPTLTG